ncbi:TonB-dependent receptor [Desulfocicer vacuolatum]|nr:TonB-dependent receptor [Desulfocicer vacuolatum]
MAWVNVGLCGEDTPVELESTIVTAGKIKAAADDFPGSISIADGKFMEEHQAGTTEEMTRFIPNIFYKTSTSGDAFVSRGISTLDTSIYTPMGLYINDVAYPLSYMQAQSLFDIQRVEVLRGPQSTLYGKNSSSGVINIVWAPPGNEMRAGAFVEGGSYQTWSGGAMISGPIKKDTLFYEASFMGHVTDGYMENQINRSDDFCDDQAFSGRGTLRWTPSADLDFSLTLVGTDRDMGIGDLRYLNGPSATDRFRGYSNHSDRAEQNSLGQSLRGKYRFGTLDLLSITSHQSFTRNAVMDADRMLLDLGVAEIDLDQDSWSQEFRISSSEGFFSSWLLGLYAGRDCVDNDWALNHVNAMVANQRLSDSDTDSFALFGQSTLALTHRLDATVGLRMDHVAASGSQTYIPHAGAVTYSKDISETELLPMASLSYAFTDSINGYFTFSTGWMAGGYDYYFATSEDNFAYDPEYTMNYEAGIKTAFFNNRLRTSLAVFYTRIDDKQVKEEVPGSGFTAWKITNAAKAHTTGIEFEVNALPVHNLEIFGGIGYARAEIDDWTGTSGGEFVNYSGNLLPWAPDLTANVGVGYYLDNGWYGIADLFWAGRQFFDAANTLEDNGYALVNLKLGYVFDHYDISVWGKNIFDEYYAQKKLKDSMGNTMVEDGDPMTLGVTLRWRF